MSSVPPMEPPVCMEASGVILGDEESTIHQGSTHLANSTMAPFWEASVPMASSTHTMLGLDFYHGTVLGGLRSNGVGELVRDSV